MGDLPIQYWLTTHNPHVANGIVMKQRCLACGVEKDTSVKEVYPYREEDGIIDEPIEPLCTIDCQIGYGLPAADWRVVTVCHECYHKLQPDMWINDVAWRSLNPITPFEQLPKLEEE